VGGGFGIKAHLFPEEVVLCLLTRKLGRPVRWLETRREHFLACIHAREQMHTLEVAARADGTLLGIRDRVVSDAGAYSAYPWGAAEEAAAAVRNVPGPYKVPAYACESVAVLTNKCPIGPYRGVARPVTTFVMERMMDRVARALGLDPYEVRLKNLVQPGEFPYRSITGFVFDSGSYVESLEKVLSASGYREWRERQPALRDTGRYVGVGISCYAEASAWGTLDYNRRGLVGLIAYDQAIATMEPSGHVTLRVGNSSQGQNLETTLAQVVADELGVEPADVRVIHGDTVLCPYGAGAFASHGTVTSGGAAAAAAQSVRAKVLAVAAHVLEADAADLVLGNGTVHVRGVPDRRIALRDVANVAYLWPSRLPQGTECGLEGRAYYDPPTATFSNASHVAVVEVDRETGRVRLLRYVVVEDCGRMINPIVVDGQVHGGVAQGVGGALFEQLVYDDSGQLLTGTLMDYALPRAGDLPDIEVSHIETPSPFTPGGRKGMGEGGTIGAHAAIANAVADALAPLGVEVSELPLSPESVWRLTNKLG
jgi:carbon-monoxide dehydrogenase large subunit